MFRTQANPMDDAVVKATDENLTSENWEFILDVCDRVSSNSSGPQQAIAALIKRLAHRNANVQLYTLELANALSQNCGPELHRELASKAFTDALLRLTADRNTHAQVKQKVVERMGVWSEEFRKSPELGIMEQAYQKLRVSQPGLLPPSKPVKREISNEDRQKEEDELQMALALSIKDKGTAETTSQVEDDPQSQHPYASPQPSAPQGTTAATVSRVRALYDFTPSEPGELAFQKNDVIAVLESVYKDWWKGSLRGQTGIFPLNYVEKLQDPTREELERDANMEAEVFGEIKNVEKLLALLSVGGEGGGRRGEREEEEISELYQRTLSIRPKLIELIARYSQKKDDFTQLNEKFIKARRDYEALLEASMSQSQYHQASRPLQQYPLPSRHTPQPGYSAQVQQQQPPYGGPSQPVQNYALQNASRQQRYPAQQDYGAPPPQPDSQRYFTPNNPETQTPQSAYGHTYASQQSQPTGPAAPFHFIPGGIAGLAPTGENAGSPGPQSATTGGESEAASTGFVNFQGQVRPNSIHTLNSGNPQELGTGTHESPADHRRPFPAGQSTELQAHSSGPAHSYAPQSLQQNNPAPYAAHLQSDIPLPLHIRNERKEASHQQQGPSAEPPTSLQQGGQGQAQQYTAVPPPDALANAGGSSDFTTGNAQPAAYQAYQPYPQQYQQHAPQPLATGGRDGGAPGASDPGDFYR